MYNDEYHWVRCQACGKWVHAPKVVDDIVCIECKKSYVD